MLLSRRKALNPYHEHTMAMGRDEWDDYTGLYLPAQAALMGLPDDDSFSPEQLDQLMTLWKLPRMTAPTSLVAAAGYATGGFVVGWFLGLLIARLARRAPAAPPQAANQTPPSWY